MLIDRCLMTKNKSTGEWVGIVEVKKREGERWRFFAWVTLFIALFEVFRLSQVEWLSFSIIEYIILFVSTFATLFFFRQSSKCELHREAAIIIPPAVPLYDSVGQTLDYRQDICLPRESSEKWERYPVTQFSHVVFGIVDYPMPGRRGINIDAYAIYLAEKDGTPHAIVEGAFDKYSSFTLARRIAALTKLPFAELGKGHPFSPDKSGKEADAGK